LGAGTESGESDRCNGRIVAFSITENVDKITLQLASRRHRHALEYHQSTSISLSTQGHLPVFATTRWQLLRRHRHQLPTNYIVR
jgi:hypothetical protein